MAVKHLDKNGVYNRFFLGFAIYFRELNSRVAERIKYESILTLVTENANRKSGANRMLSLRTRPRQ